MKNYLLIAAGGGGKKFAVPNTLVKIFKLKIYIIKSSTVKLKKQILNFQIKFIWICITFSQLLTSWIRISIWTRIRMEADADPGGGSVFLVRIGPDPDSPHWTKALDTA